MNTKTLQERVDARKDRYPFGFASKKQHRMHHERKQQDELEEAIAKTQERIATIEDEASGR